MVDIRKAINDLVKGIGEEADCMVIICKKGDVVRNGILGIDKLAIGPDAIALATAMKAILDGPLGTASKIADVLLENGAHRIVEVGRASGPMEEREKHMNQLLKETEERVAEKRAKAEARQEAVDIDEAVRDAFHGMLENILDKIMGGEDDADDD